MNASEFARQRARLTREYHGRGRKYNRALAHLVRDARAALVVMDRKVVGYRLPTGEMVCVKHRYRSEDEATRAMQRIQEEAPEGQRVPLRVYPCPHCRGFHTTSQARNAA